MASARERILDAALDLIGTRGLDAVTHRDVAAAAGVSPGATTYHFAAKYDLLAAALERFCDQEVTRIRGAVAALPRAVDDADAEAFLDVLAEHLQVTLHDRPRESAMLQLYIHAARDPRLARAADACLTVYRELARTHPPTRAPSR